MFFAAAVVMAALGAFASAKESRSFAVNHFYGKGPLVEGRMDPIVSPGAPSGHAHTIQGGNAFAMTLGDTTLLSSTCTSSLIKNDKSVYWTPKMYFYDEANKTFEDVPLFYMNVYYFFEATDDPIVAFPQGLRMFSGDSELRTPPATGGAQILDPADGTIQPVQFTCPRSSYDIPSYPANSDGMHGVGMQDPSNKGAGAGFPDMNCDGYASPLRADIHFPSCYNPAVGLHDYKNNMAWPTRVGTTGQKQNCPTGYIHVPHIFYEVYWNTPLFNDRWTQGQGKQPFVLSNGDDTGYSLHADFVAGWDIPTLQQIIDNCDAGDSGMDKCPGLIGGVNDPGSSCNIQSSVNEQIDGILTALPGNNPITGWATSGGSPAPAPLGSSSSSAVAAVASSGSPASSVYGGGYGYASSSAAGPVSSISPSPIYGDGYVYPSSSPSSMGSSSTIAPGYAQSTPSSTAGTSPISPDYDSPDSASSLSATSLATSAAASKSPDFDSGPANSACVVVTVTTTMTAWYTSPAGSSIPTTTSPSSSSSSSPTNPSIPNWAYAGCYTDVLDSRVLSCIEFANLGHHNTTTTGCVAYCDAEGYAVAGTEYAGQCFCGNSLASTSMRVADGMCGMACEGDAGQICGGDLVLSVYTKDGSAWKKKRRGAERFGRRALRL